MFKNIGCGYGYVIFSNTSDLTLSHDIGYNSILLLPLDFTKHSLVLVIVLRVLLLLIMVLCYVPGSVLNQRSILLVKSSYIKNLKYIFYSIY